MTCDNTLHVKPDIAKGKIIITDDDFIGPKKLLWINSETSQIGESLILIPNVSKFAKVVSSKDRVYLITTSGKRLFIYMQEPDVANDEEIASKVNNIINEPVSEPMSDSSPSYQPPLDEDEIDMNQFNIHPILNFYE